MLSLPSLFFNDAHYLYLKLIKTGYYYQGRETFMHSVLQWAIKIIKLLPFAPVWQVLLYSEPNLQGECQVFDRNQEAVSEKTLTKSCRVSGGWWGALFEALLLSEENAWKWWESEECSLRMVNFSLSAGRSTRIKCTLGTCLSYLKEIIRIWPAWDVRPTSPSAPSRLCRWWEGAQLESVLSSFLRLPLNLHLSLFRSSRFPPSLCSAWSAWRAERSPRRQRSSAWSTRASTTTFCPSESTAAGECFSLQICVCLQRVFGHVQFVCLHSDKFVCFDTCHEVAFWFHELQLVILSWQQKHSELKS